MSAQQGRTRDDRGGHLGANNCLYCVVAHGAVLRIRAKNPRVADQLATNYHRKAEITARQRAMLDFAMKLSLDGAGSRMPTWRLCASTVSTTRRSGISVRSPLSSMSNRLVHLTGTPPNEQFYLMGRLPKAECCNCGCAALASGLCSTHWPRRRACFDGETKDVCSPHSDFCRQRPSRGALLRLLSACIRPLEVAGAQLNVVDLADYPAPLYNGDLEVESGIPVSMVTMQQHFAASDGVLVVSPEYNGSIPPLLKNTLDWCSRPNPPILNARGGIFAGARRRWWRNSPGPMGGMRVLFHLRDILGYPGMYVIPQQLGVGRANTAIGDDLRLIDLASRPAMRGHRQCPDHGSLQAACLRSPALSIEQVLLPRARRIWGGGFPVRRALPNSGRRSIGTVHLRSLRSDRGPAG